jgi:hypothetical protein
MRIQDLPPDIHRCIIEFLEDDFKELHKKRMAPTFRILERFVYPCRICMRNTMHEDLCRVCIGTECEALNAHIPTFLHSRLLYIPFPRGMQEDVLEFLRFWFALRHLDFTSRVSTIPFLPGGLKAVDGDVLIVSLFRRTTLQHLFLRAPTRLFPSWTWTDTDPMVATLETPFVFPFPPYTNHVQSELDTFRCLNSLFPR